MPAEAGIHRGDHFADAGEFLARFALRLTSVAFREVNGLPIRIADDSCPIAGEGRCEVACPRLWRGIEHCQILDDAANRFDAVRPVVADETARTALDPSRHIEAGDRLLSVQAAPFHVRNGAACFIESDSWQSYALIAAASKHQAARQVSCRRSRHLDLLELGPDVIVIGK